MSTEDPPMPATPGGARDDGREEPATWTAGQDLAAAAAELVDPAGAELAVPGGSAGPARGPEVTRVDGMVLAEETVSAAQRAFASYLETEAADALVNALNPAVEAVIGAASDDAVRRVLAGGGTVKPTPRYRDVEEWVLQFLLPHYRRPVSGEFYWCPKWWEHTEAISRLKALWYAWEEARYGGAAAMAAWWLHFADPMLTALTDRRGVFQACVRGHTVPDLLTVAPAPKGMFSQPE